MASPGLETVSYATTLSSYTTDNFNIIQPSTDSFWDVGNFKNVARRVDDSAHLCDDLVKLISERAHIEQRYAFKLNEWSRKWGELITRSQEYGTMKETWHASLVEATRTADVHLRMNNRLVDYVVEEAKIWKRDKFHKSILGWKETRRVENGFSKAQKPWAVLYGKVQRAKKSYYQASKSYFSICQRIDELENTVGYSLAKVQKEKEKVLRVEGHLHRAQIKYKTRLDDLHNYQEQYIIDMTREYDSWQEMEQERLHSFIQIFEDCSKALDITQFKHLDKIYEEFDRVIQRTSPEDDLTWFAQHHGKDMPRIFPQYEEYPASSDEVIQMTDQKVPTYNPTPRPMFSGSPLPPKDPTTSLEEPTPFGAPFYPQQDVDIDINLSSRLTGLTAPRTAVLHDYDIPDVNTGETPLTDLPVLDEPDEWAPPPRPKEIGTKMRARYDFEAEEDDDLPFKAGDIITMFGEEKDGWVQATLSGEVGYAPFEYLEPVPTSSPSTS